MPTGIGGKRRRKADGEFFAAVGDKKSQQVWCGEARAVRGRVEERHKRRLGVPPARRSREHPHSDARFAE